MPDDTSSDCGEQEAAQIPPEAVVVSDPHVAPIASDCQPSQTVGEKNVGRDVQDVEDRVKRAEWWMILPPPLPCLLLVA